MNTKLTLRLDERLIRRAKAYAKRSGKSVSQIVAEYFAFLGRLPEAKDRDLTPTVRSLKGVLRGQALSRTGYRRHLEEKYR